MWNEEGNEEYVELVKSKEYDFLRDNSKLDKNIMMLVMGGSRAYGTNNDDSDYDVRGVFAPTHDEIMSYSVDDASIHDEKTDTKMHSLPKVIKLLKAGNPAILEMFGVDDEDIIYITPSAQLLMDNIDLFFSLQCYNSFGGYAIQLEKEFERLAAKENRTDYEAKRMWKTAMNTIRILEMGQEILEEHKFGTAVINYNQLKSIHSNQLKSIRNGKEHIDQVRYWIKKCRENFEYARKQSVLPDKVDEEAINKLVIRINKMNFKNMN